MSDCSAKCENNPLVYCRHRFNFNPKIKYYNTKRYQNYCDTKKGWPDSKILLNVLESARKYIEAGELNPDVSIVILTRDIKFLRAAEQELGSDIRGNDIIFSGNFVTCGGITIYIKILDCKVYGNDRYSDLKCAIYKMNRFFKNLRA